MVVPPPMRYPLIGPGAALVILTSHTKIIRDGPHDWTPAWKVVIMFLSVSVNGEVVDPIGLDPLVIVSASYSLSAVDVGEEQESIEKSVSSYTIERLLLLPP
ncbi:hypothetical protein Tco_0539559 [Tanacetum coccineum]